LAYVETTVSASELAALAKDIPLFVGNQILENYSALPQWRVSGSLASGSDISDNVDFPVWRGFDRGANSLTRSTGVNGQTEVSYICTLTPDDDDLHTADAAFIIQHNFHLLGGNVTITLDIADNNSFSSNLITLATWVNPTAALRLGSLNFRALSRRYTDITYLRLRIRKTSGAFSTTIPSFGELWVGRRRQLAHFPVVPGWDERATRSNFVDHVSDGNVRSRYFLNNGQRFYQAELVTVDDDGTGYNETDEVRGWWQDCEEGKPSIFVESPGTAVVTVGESATIVFPGDENYMPLQGPFDRQASFDLAETSPHLQAELRAAGML
jgi:hypothetical protein